MSIITQIARRHNLVVARFKSELVDLIPAEDLNLPKLVDVGNVSFMRAMHVDYDLCYTTTFNWSTIVVNNVRKSGSIIGYEVFLWDHALKSSTAVKLERATKKIVTSIDEAFLKRFATSGLTALDKCKKEELLDNRSLARVQLDVGFCSFPDKMPLYLTILGHKFKRSNDTYLVEDYKKNGHKKIAAYRPDGGHRDAWFSFILTEGHADDKNKIAVYYIYGKYSRRKLGTTTVSDIDHFDAKELEDDINEGMHHLGNSYVKDELIKRFEQPKRVKARVSGEHHFLPSLEDFFKRVPKQINIFGMPFNKPQQFESTSFFRTAILYKSKDRLLEVCVTPIIDDEDHIVAYELHVGEYFSSSIRGKSYKLGNSVEFEHVPSAEEIKDFIEGVIKKTCSDEAEFKDMFPKLFTQASISARVSLEHSKFSAMNNRVPNEIKVFGHTFKYVKNSKLEKRDDIRYATHQKFSYVIRPSDNFGLLVYTGAGEEMYVRVVLNSMVSNLTYGLVRDQNEFTVEELQEGIEENVSKSFRSRLLSLINDAYPEAHGSVRYRNG